MSSVLKKADKLNLSLSLSHGFHSNILKFTENIYFVGLNKVLCF